MGCNLNLFTGNLNWSFTGWDSPHFVSQVTKTTLLVYEFVEIMCYSTGQKPTENYHGATEITWQVWDSMKQTWSKRRPSGDLWTIEEIILLNIITTMRRTLHLNVSQLFFPRSKNLHFVFIYVMLSLSYICKITKQKQLTQTTTNC